ncbi:hypothetical protein EVAR_970_1 [Eumeta japonica]|uniref:Uncharacterized protein n=1 Tax=Eumeta variegata TaxID=151549 RepID=A0A4C1SE03_EUMVA|nr:hypothetical protein EVAR_970_1 [Eumeta japonica]
MLKPHTSFGCTNELHPQPIITASADVRGDNVRREDNGLLLITSLAENVRCFDEWTRKPAHFTLVCAHAHRSGRSGGAGFDPDRERIDR